MNVLKFGAAIARLACAFILVFLPFVAVGGPNYKIPACGAGIGFFVAAEAGRRIHRLFKNKPTGRANRLAKEAAEKLAVWEFAGGALGGTLLACLGLTIMYSGPTAPEASTGYMLAFGGLAMLVAEIWRFQKEQGFLKDLLSLAGAGIVFLAGLHWPEQPLWWMALAGAGLVAHYFLFGIINLLRHRPTTTETA
jgi:hypothetical protein